jgi:DNA ligase D
VASASDDAVEVEVAGRPVRISRPGKELFPGITKLELLERYRAVAGPLLDAWGGRPVLLERFPDGVGGPSFFQKRIPASAPRWLQTTGVVTVNGTRSQALVIADLAHLAWAVGQGCLAFHVWAHRAADPGHTDELRIDLDPAPGVDFAAVRAAAGATRDLLTELGLVGFPKTSGGRGVHVYVPLAPRWDAVTVRAGAVAFARELARRHPDLVTDAWWKEERGARVFVDYNQNAPHKTMIGAWSTRPAPGAPVSTPFTWDELEGLEPAACTIRTVGARLAARGDPWAAKAGLTQPLDALLAWAERDAAAGLPDAPWPPQYPKMPGEARRVAPSRARRDR